MNDDRIVRLMEFSSPDEAEIARGILEAHGVDCDIFHSTIQTLIPFIPNSPELVVRESDKEFALKLLAAEFDPKDIMP